MTNLFDYLSKRKLPEILLVDDDETFRELALMMVEQTGVGQPLVACDGESAIAAAFDHRPAIVLLDYQMPVLDGRAVASVLKLLSPDSTVIAVSGILRDQPNWVDGFITKIELPALLRRVATLQAQAGHDDDEAEVWLQAVDAMARKRSKRGHEKAKPDRGLIDLRGETGITAEALR